MKIETDSNLYWDMTKQLRSMLWNEDITENKNVDGTQIIDFFNDPQYIHLHQADAGRGVRLDVCNDIMQTAGILARHSSQEQIYTALKTFIIICTALKYFGDTSQENAYSYGSVVHGLISSGCRGNSNQDFIRSIYNGDFNNDLEEMKTSVLEKLSPILQQHFKTENVSLKNLFLLDKASYSYKELMPSIFELGDKSIVEQVYPNIEKNNKNDYFIRGFLSNNVDYIDYLIKKLDINVPEIFLKDNLSLVGHIFSSTNLKASTFDYIIQLYSKNNSAPSDEEFLKQINKNLSHDKNPDLYLHFLKDYSHKVYESRFCSTLIFNMLSKDRQLKEIEINSLIQLVKHDTNESIKNLLGCRFFTKEHQNNFTNFNNEFCNTASYEFLQETSKCVDFYLEHPAIADSYSQQVNPNLDVFSKNLKKTITKHNLEKMRQSTDAAKHIVKKV